MSHGLDQGTKSQPLSFTAANVFQFGDIGPQLTRGSPAAVPVARTAAPPEKTVLTDDFEPKVRPYIDLIDKLRSLGIDEDVPLPAVVVIGDQSTGKSSVLEAISAVKLPRGTGIVTRCALELRMKRIEEASWKATISYNELPSSVSDRLRTPERRRTIAISNPEAIGEEVRKAQNVLAGKGSGISSNGLIRLEIESPDVPDLTLIDLPGIARVPIPGQGDISKQTKALIRKFISKEETIILCVIPCNVDIATTEALKLAHDADPMKTRTLGVMTKPDIADKGTESEIVKIARNKTEYNLKLGYTVVRCRCQDDVDKRMSLQAAIEQEKEFFEKHKYYQVLVNENKTGIQNLSKTLVKQLVVRIQRCLPKLKKSVAKLVKETDRELRLLGEPLPKDKKQFLMKLLYNFGHDVRAVGAGEKNSEHENLYALVHKSFTTFAQDIEKLRPGRNQAEEREKIKKRLQTCRGPELPTFLPFPVFRTFAIDKVKEMLDPALELMDTAQNYVEEILTRMIDKHFGPYRNLRSRVVDKLLEYLLKRKEEALKDIKRIFEKENYIFTQDITYRGLLHEVELERTMAQQQQGVIMGRKARVAPPFSPMMEVTGTSTVSRASDMNTEAAEMLTKLTEYNKVVRARLGDTIPMTIYFSLVTSLVKDLTDNLPSEIAFQKQSLTLDEIGDDDDDDDDGYEWSAKKLLEEDEEVAAKRKRLDATLKRLLQAQRELNQRCPGYHGFVEDLEEYDDAI